MAWAEETDLICRKIWAVKRERTSRLDILVLDSTIYLYKSEKVKNLHKQKGVMKWECVRREGLR